MRDNKGRVPANANEFEFECSSKNPSVRKAGVFILFVILTIGLYSYSRMETEEEKIGLSSSNNNPHEPQEQDIHKLHNNLQHNKKNEKITEKEKELALEFDKQQKEEDNDNDNNDDHDDNENEKGAHRHTQERSLSFLNDNKKGVVEESIHELAEHLHELKEIHGERKRAFDKNSRSRSKEAEEQSLLHLDAEMRKELERKIKRDVKKELEHLMAPSSDEGKIYSKDSQGKQHSPLLSKDHHKQKDSKAVALITNRERSLDEIDPSKKPLCGHWVGRDYRIDPIFSNVRSERREVLQNCDVPCIWDRDANPRVMDITAGRGSGTHSCPHTFGFVQTMEASYGEGKTYPPLGSTIYSFTDLGSDVPAPYFSWVEYGFMEKLEPKKKGGAMAAAWISNCGGSNGRLQYLQKLMNAGVTIDSYGACLHNKDGSSSGKSNWFKAKIDALKQYKFAIAFENTNLKDYVTEKLFMSFIAGAVPVHMGVPDVHKFGPSNRSIISVHDFESPEELAKYLIYLDNHPEEYEKYLDWKWKGYSKDFQAMVDLSNEHSTCRACIEAADRYRLTIGEPHPAVRPFPEDDLSIPRYTNETFIRIRPRGKFWMRMLWFPKTGISLQELLVKAREILRLAPNQEIYGVQTRARPHVLLNTQQLVDEYVVPEAELEAIVLEKPDFSYLKDLYPERYRK